VIWGAILLAFGCWGITFGWAGGNFWVKIGLFVLPFFPLLSKPRINLRAVPSSWPFSAGFYIFYLGTICPYILPALKLRWASTSWEKERAKFYLPSALLPCRSGRRSSGGVLQDHLIKWGFSGFLVGTLIYAGVHVFSFNFMLILAALLAGAFWGFLYLWKRDLWVQITSHSFWSAVIFAVAPIQA
jgi:membrane protease YdiL (CAAX protease family)